MSFVCGSCLLIFRRQPACTMIWPEFPFYNNADNERKSGFDFILAKSTAYPNFYRLKRPNPFLKMSKITMNKEKQLDTGSSASLLN